MGASGILIFSTPEALEVTSVTPCPKQFNSGLSQYASTEKVSKMKLFSLHGNSEMAHLGIVRSREYEGTMIFMSISNERMLGNFESLSLWLIFVYFICFLHLKRCACSFAF